MYKNIAKGKEAIQDILSEEKDNDIFSENDSIIENIDMYKDLNTNTQTI